MTGIMIFLLCLAACLVLLIVDHQIKVRKIETFRAEFMGYMSMITDTINSCKTEPMVLMTVRWARRVLRDRGCMYSTSSDISQILKISGEARKFSQMIQFLADKKIDEIRTKEDNDERNA